MTTSLGLSAYRALSARGTAPIYRPSTARPAGELIWIHAAEPGSGRAISDLARLLMRARPGLSVIVTIVDDTRIPPTEGLQFEPVPVDHPETVKMFMQHWRPTVVLWVWGDLQPNLILEAAANGAKLFLIDAGQDGFQQRREKWLPEVPRKLLSHFDWWLARSEAAQMRLVQYGCPMERVERVHSLQPVGQTLPVANSELDEMRGHLGGRPVWYGRAVTNRELPVVLAAHISALRSSHRLLLILEPAEGADLEWMDTTLKADGLRTRRWTTGEPPDDNCQVLIADEPDDAGLWYRLAPVSFLGSSLYPDGRGRDPYEAAAHGSAVLYGPNVPDYQRSYSRLATVGAARVVSDETSLAMAITRLIAPDQSALMATAAWDVITQGAMATDRVLALVEDALDARHGDTG